MRRPLLVLLLTCASAFASENVKSYSEWLTEGKALTAAGKYPSAIQAFRQALVIAEHSNANDRALASIYDALASLYTETGQYSEAENEYHKGLTLIEKAEGRRSLDYALLAAGLAVLPAQSENREFFVTTLREALVGNDRSGSVRELSVLRLCLAQLLTEGNQQSEAESVLLGTRGYFETLRRENPKLLAELLNQFGLVCFGQGHFEDSAQHYRDSLELLKDMLGDKHPILIAPLSNLATSYAKLGRLGDAERLLSQASNLCGKTLSEGHPVCGTVLENYAAVLKKLGQKRAAKALQAQAREIARVSRRRNGVGWTVSVAGRI